MGSEEHWETVYRTKTSEGLGWYEPKPSTLDLVRRFSLPSDSIIDVGAGDSRLADELLQAGYDDITMLDLSETALDRARSRLGSAARRVTWIQADVTSWTPTRRWSLWHDRAVFHFLISDEDRQAYKTASLQSLTADGKLIVAAFTLEGPEQCAGLPVERYDAHRLAAVFDPEFRSIEHQELQARKTSVGDQRPYVAVVLQRV